MRTLVAISVICCSVTPGHAQELIPNPGFEEATGCPVGPGELELATPWVLPTLGTSDYFNPCGGATTSTPDNAVGTQAPADGLSYAGVIALNPLPPFEDYREYLQAQLEEPLVAGKTYRFSMHFSLAENSSAATDRIGAYVSTTPVGSSDNLVLPFTPQFETPAGTLLDDTVEWMGYTGTFVAEGLEQYITIGNFRDFATALSAPAGFGPSPPLQEGIAYYYVDAVSLVCQACIMPPSDMIAWWRLDEEVPGVAVDSIGAQHGVVTGFPTAVTGLVDGALDLGAGAVLVPSAPPLELGTGDFTIDAWVRPATLGSMQTLLAKMAPLPIGPGYALALKDDGTLRFTMIDDTAAAVTVESTAALDPGAWTFVEVSVDRDDSSGGRLHVDGSIVTFDPTPAPGDLGNTLPLLFGTDGGAGVGLDFDGSLDEIEMFDRALSESETKWLYESRTSGKCKVALEIDPVTPICVGPVVIDAEITNDPSGTGSVGATGTFVATVRGEVAGTTVGRLHSTVNGPQNAVVLTPQPMQIAAGESATLRLRLDAPWNLIPGALACYSVTLRHVETGREYVSRAMLRGCQRGTPELRR